MRLSLNRDGDGKMISAKVKGRAMDEDGKPPGREDENPMLDTRQSVVEYINGESEIMTAKIIAENILSQVDDHGYGQRQLDGILNHCTTDEAVPMHEGWITTKTGQK